MASSALWWRGNRRLAARLLRSPNWSATAAATQPTHNANPAAPRPRSHVRSRLLTPYAVNTATTISIASRGSIACSSWTSPLVGSRSAAPGSDMDGAGIGIWACSR
jgi:hypothetical protein